MQNNHQHKMILEPFSEEELQSYEKDCQQPYKCKQIMEKKEVKRNNAVATSMPITFTSKIERSKFVDEEECMMGINYVMKSTIATENTLTKEKKSDELSKSSQLVLAKPSSNWYEEPSLPQNECRKSSARNMLDCSYKSPRGDVGHEVFKWRLACKNYCSPLPLCGTSHIYHNNNSNKNNNTNTTIKDEKELCTKITVRNEHVSKEKCHDEIHSSNTTTNSNNNNEKYGKEYELSSFTPLIRQDSDVGLYTRNRKERRKENINLESKNQELFNTAHNTRVEHNSHTSAINLRQERDIHNNNNFESHWEEISDIHDSNELTKAREQEKITCEANIHSRANDTFPQEEQLEISTEVHHRHKSEDNEEEQEEQEQQKQQVENEKLEEEEYSSFAQCKDEYTKAEFSANISAERSSFYSSFSSVTAQSGDCVGRHATKCTFSHSSNYAQHTQQEDKCPSLSPVSSKITTAHSSQSSSSRLSRCKERLRSLSKPAFSLAPIEAAQERNMSMIFECSMSGNVESTSDEQESICNAAMCHPISQINEFLYIGTWKDAANRELLDSLNIHYILNVAQELEDGCQSSVSVASFCEQSSSNIINNNRKKLESNNFNGYDNDYDGSGKSNLSIHTAIPTIDSEHKNFNHDICNINKPNSNSNEKIENNYALLHARKDDIYPVKSLWLPMSDCHHTDISTYFDDAFEFIEDARRHHGKILVHCRRGISRSAAMVIAYLMATTGKSYKEVWQFVQERRRCISLNLGFQELLSEYVSDKRWRHPSPVHLREENDTNVHCCNNISDYNAFRVNTNIKQTLKKHLTSEVHGNFEQIPLHHTSAVEINNKNNASMATLEMCSGNTAVDDIKETEESTFPFTCALPPRREVWEQRKQKEKEYKEREQEENDEQPWSLSLSSSVESTEPLDLSVSERWLNVKKRLELKENSFISSNASGKDNPKNTKQCSVTTFEKNNVMHTHFNSRHEVMTDKKSDIETQNYNNIDERIDDHDDDDDGDDDSSIFTLIKLQSEPRTTPNMEEEQVQELQEPMSPKRYTHHLMNSSFECSAPCLKRNTCITESEGSEECPVDWEEPSEESQEECEEEELESSESRQKCNKSGYLSEHVISNREESWQEEEELEEEELEKLERQNVQNFDDICASKSDSALHYAEEEDKLEEEEPNDQKVHGSSDDVDNHHSLHMSEKVKTTLLQPTKENKQYCESWADEQFIRKWKENELIVSPISINECKFSCANWSERFSLTSSGTAATTQTNNSIDEVHLHNPLNIRTECHVKSTINNNCECKVQTDCSDEGEKNKTIKNVDSNEFTNNSNNNNNKDNINIRHSSDSSVQHDQQQPTI